jgi:transcriptional regulator with XRE-family HTH domain
MKPMQEQLARLIEEKGGNKSLIAKKLGISRQLLGQYLQGRHNPKIDFWIKWKRAFNEDPLKLVGDFVMIKHHPTDETKPANVDEMFTRLKAEHEEGIKLRDEIINAKNQTIAILSERLADLKNKVDELEKLLVNRNHTQKTDK